MPHLPEEDHSAARTAKTLVRRGGDHVRELERGWDDPGRHQATDVRHVREQPSPRSAGDLLHAGVVDGARVRAGSGNDQLEPRTTPNKDRRTRGSEGRRSLPTSAPNASRTVTTKGMRAPKRRRRVVSCHIGRPSPWVGRASRSPPARRSRSGPCSRPAGRGTFRNTGSPASKRCRQRGIDAHTTYR